MQKEQLSALMDGEIQEQTSLLSLTQNQDLQDSWGRYHLIRDALRGDLDAVIHLDISEKVASAIAKLPVLQDVSVKDSQASGLEKTQLSTAKKRPFWANLSGFGSHFAQAALAAGVSLVVIAGVRQFGRSDSPHSAADLDKSPAFVTLPLYGKTSPVSFGVPDNSFDNEMDQQQAQSQRNHVSAMLKDFELQRRLGYEESVPNSSAATNSANP